MIYLNNAASTFPKPVLITNSLLENFTHFTSSSRSLSFDNPLDDCRKVVADFLNVSYKNIIFTSGCTMALNMAIFGFPFNNGDHVVISSLEHHALIRPILDQAEKYNLIIHDIPCKDGIFDMENYKEIINNFDIRLVALTYASNVLGNILPINDITKLAHNKNITTLIDCAQAAGYIDIDMTHIDIAAFPGHKGLYGPTGVGFLYTNQSINLKPITTGGTGGDSGKYRIEQIKIPSSYEVGTQPVFLIKTLCEGILWVQETGLSNIYNHEMNLYKNLLNEMKMMDHVIIYGNHDKNHLAIISFNIKNMNCKEVEQKLFNKYNIIVRAGFHCSSPTHNTINTISIGGCVRVSMGYFNTENHIKLFINALKKIY